MTLDAIVQAVGKPYFRDDAVVIYHADCRDILPLIPPESIDLVLTDPPYGIEGGRGVGNRARGKAVYTKGWQDTPEYIAEVCAPVINSAVKAVSRVVLTPGIRHLHLYPVPDDMGCFWTPAAIGTGSWGLTTFHPILYYGRDPRAGIGAWPSGRQVTEAPGIDGHPCPKPLKAWTWLLAKASVSVGETILDPFMGSGTTLVAAQALGRKSIGIEIEEKYCWLAVERLRQKPLPLLDTMGHDMIRPTQGGLFDGPSADRRNEAQDFTGEQGPDTLARPEAAAKRDAKEAVPRRQAEDSLGGNQGADDMESQGARFALMERRKGD